MWEVVKDRFPVLNKLDPLRNQWLGDPRRHVPATERSGHLLTLELPADAVATLLQRCRERRLTGAWALLVGLCLAMCVGLSHAHNTTRACSVLQCTLH